MERAAILCGKLGCLRKFVPLFYAGAVATLILHATVGGVGVSTDSRVYAQWAQKIAENGLFAFLSENPSGTFPFFYPLLLSFGLRIFDGNLDVAAIVLNVLCSCATVLLFYGFVKRNVESVFCAHFTMIGLCFSLTFLNGIWIMAWSEGLFVALCLGTLTALADENQPPKRMALCAVCIVLACMTRYVGVTLIGAAFLLAFGKDGAQWRVDWKQVLWTVVVPSLALAALLLRNWVVAGTPMGPRSPSGQSFFQNIGLVAQTIGECFAPTIWRIPWIGGHLPENAAVFPGALCLAFGTMEFVRRKSERRIGRDLATHATFLLVFLGFMAVSSTMVDYDPLGHRLLAPAVPSAVFLFFAMLSSFSRRAEKGRVRFLFVLFGTLALTIFASAMLRNAKQHEYGAPGRTQIVENHGPWTIEDVDSVFLPKAEKPDQNADRMDDERTLN